LTRLSEIKEAGEPGRPEPPALRDLKIKGDINVELIKALSEGQIARIKDATEELLETTGFRVQHDEVLGFCRKAGARVDEASGVVRLPRPLLRELLRQVPSSYTVRGINGDRWTVGGGTPYCQAIVTDPWIIDYETQKPRRPRLDDLRRHTAIAQTLDRVIGISRMDFPVTDVPEPTSSLRALEEHLLNHAKHYHVYVASWESFLQWLEIGQILSNGRLAGSNLFSVAVAIVSPLMVSELNVNLVKHSCEYGFTVIPTICPMAGSTSPYTLASTLLQGNAENVFLAALTQILRPGNPFLYTFGPSVTNLRTTHDMYYTLDKVLWKLAAVQLARSYNLPVIAECGGTMTYRYDQQNGAEGMLFMLAARNSGASLLAGIGSCHNAIGMSAEQMIIHTEWLRAAEFLGAGINMDDSHLALPSLKEVGPGGNFLTDDLTVRYMRGGEFFDQGLFDFAEAEHGKSLLERAHEKAEQMVVDFKSPVPDNIRESLRRYFHDEYKKLKA